MGKWNFFDFLGKKIDPAELSAIAYSLKDQLAFKELALHIGISYIANTLSKCEFLTYENGVEKKDQLYYKLNVSPNPNQSSSQFINQIIENYYYKSHALVVKHNNNLYCADSFDVEDDNPLTMNTYRNVTFKTHQAKQKYKAKEVFYFKLDNKDVKRLIDAQYTQYGEVLSAALASFKRSNTIKYKLLLDQFTAGDQKFRKEYEENIKEQLKSFIEADGTAVYPQFRGYDLQEFTPSNQKDSKDIIAMRKEVFEVVAQALKIPLSMMYGNITNMNEIVKVYLSLCIDPLADMIGEEITRKYYSYDEWKKGCYVKVDTSCINHVDILEMGNEIYNLIGAGFSIDEIRERVDKPTLDTEFSKSHFLSKNFVLAEDMLQGESKEIMKGGE